MANVWVKATNPFFQWINIPVIYCCTIKHPKIQWLKITIYSYLSQFCGLTGLSWSILWVFQEIAVKCWFSQVARWLGCLLFLYLVLRLAGRVRGWLGIWLSTSLVFIIRCSITNYQRPAAKNNTIYYLTVSTGQEFGTP